MCLFLGCRTSMHILVFVFEVLFVYISVESRLNHKTIQEKVLLDRSTKSDDL